MKHRLLVVDDERAILMAVGEYFRRRGYEVACARQREEAEALLVQEHYACVIADLRLTAQGTDDGLAIAAAFPLALRSSNGTPFGGSPLSTSARIIVRLRDVTSRSRDSRNLESIVCGVNSEGGAFIGSSLVNIRKSEPDSPYGTLMTIDRA